MPRTHHSCRLCRLQQWRLPAGRVETNWRAFSAPRRPSRGRTILRPLCLGLCRSGPSDVPRTGRVEMDRPRNKTICGHIPRNRWHLASSSDRQSQGLALGSVLANLHCQLMRPVDLDASLVAHLDQDEGVSRRWLADSGLSEAYSPNLHRWLDPFLLAPSTSPTRMAWMRG